MKKRRCQHMKAGGTRCGGFALTGAKYCFFHNPASQEARRAASSAGGSRPRLATLPADAPDLPCSTPQQALEAVVALLNAVARGGVAPQVANAAGTLLNVWKGLYELARPAQVGQQGEAEWREGEWSSVANWLRALAQETGHTDVLQLAEHLEATTPADRQRA